MSRKSGARRSHAAAGALLLALASTRAAGQGAVETADGLRLSLSAGGAVRGAIVRGILPEQEERVADLGRHMRAGALGALKPGEFGVVLGADLARALGVFTGDKLALVPLLKETGVPRMTYRITFGVRNLEDDWKHQLNDLIAKRQGDIDAVLLQFGVPLLDEQSHLITQPRR